MLDGAVASVALVTSSAQGVLAVPTSAVHTNGNRHTVEVLDKGKLTEVTVGVGTVGDTWTQVTSGLTAGQVVVLADLSEALPGSATDGSTTNNRNGNGGSTGTVARRPSPAAGRAVRRAASRTRPGGGGEPHGPRPWPLSRCAVGKPIPPRVLSRGKRAERGVAVVSSSAESTLPAGHEPSPAPDERAWFSRLAAWVARHRRAVILVWLVATLAAAPLALTLGGALSGAGWDAKGSTAEKVRAELRNDFPALGRREPGRRLSPGHADRRRPVGAGDARRRAGEGSAGDLGGRPARRCLPTPG